jgi:hypothetical protein
MIMKNMNKIFTQTLLCLLFVFIFAGCTNNSTGNDTSNNSNSIEGEKHSSDKNSLEEEAKENGDDMVSLTVDPNFGGISGRASEYPVGSEIDLSKGFYYYSREGFSRMLNLCFDPACQEEIPENKLVIKEDTTVYLGWAEWTKEEMPLINEYLDLMDEAKEITMRPKAWSGNVSAFNEYSTFIDATSTNDAKGRLTVIDNPGIIDEIISYRNKLVQSTGDVDEGVWYIWGNDIPNESSPQDFYMAFDKEDFTPFLVPYLAENQSEVKGNIIVASGGAFFQRANMSEGYPTAEFYQKNGYNAFVLQYRVAPYGQKESNADLQRAVRYIKYYGDSLGLAHPERVSAVGFSAGGMNINGMLDKFDPEELPSAYFSDYLADDVDEVSGTIDAAINIYGAMEGAIKNPETKTLPEMFFVVGEKDSTVAVGQSLSMYQDIYGLTRSELHVFADGIHGIGLGSTWNHGTYPAFHQWGDLSLTFLDITYGYQEKHIDN